MSPWVFPVEGQLAASGLALVRPLALDLSALISTFNGRWDRDNVGPIKIDATKGSTITSPFASKFTTDQTAVASGTFTLSGRGRKLFPPDMPIEATIDTQDARLLLTLSTTVRIAHSAPGAGYLPIDLAVGLLVDGVPVWRSGWERVLLCGSYTPNDMIDVGFARVTVQVDVGAGAHYVCPFLDFELGEPTAAGMDVAPDECRILETALYIEEVRR